MIEVTIVMGLLAIVGSLGLFISMESLRGGSFRNDRDAVVSSLQRARSLAINNMCFGSGCTDGKAHGVYFKPDMNGVIIFQTDPEVANYTADPMADEFIEFDSAATKVTAEKTIIFNRLNAKLLPAGTSDIDVTLTGDVGRTSTIKVNSEGRIDWTN